ncbi:MAG: hypothetical protein VB934_20885 [Polyangiaceae bacterium]
MTRATTNQDQGDAARHGEVGQILRNLHKVLGVCRLYDRGNDLVANFEEQLNEGLRDYLQTNASLKVGVRPNSFEFGKEPVEAPGLDELALALFRQGIISLTFTPEIDRKQVSTFIDVLNSGMRDVTSSEDLATRLWRADLPGVSYTSVLGYQEAGDDDDEDALDVDEDAIGSTLEEITEASPLDGDDVEALENVDVKAELKEGLADLKPAMQDLVDRLQAEDADTLHQHFIRVVHEAVMSPVAAETFSEAEIDRLMTIMFDLVLENGSLDNLDRYQSMLTDLAQSAFAPVAQRRLAERHSDEQVLTFVERALGHEAVDRERLTTMLTEHALGLRTRLSQLSEATDHEGVRQLLSAAMVGAAAGDIDFLVRSFRTADLGELAEALDVLAHADPAQARQALAVRLAVSEPDIQRLLLEGLGRIAGLYDHRIRGTLLRLVAKGAPVRHEILKLIGAQRDKGAVRPLAAWVKEDEFVSWDPDSIETALRFVLSMVADASGVKLVEHLLAKKSLLRRRALVVVKVAAVRALAESRSAAAEDLLQRLADDKDKQLRDASRAAIAERAGGGS